MVTPVTRFRPDMTGVWGLWITSPVASEHGHQRFRQIIGTISLAAAEISASCAFRRVDDALDQRGERLEGLRLFGAEGVAVVNGPDAAKLMP